MNSIDNQLLDPNRKEPSRFRETLKQTAHILVDELANADDVATLLDQVAIDHIDIAAARFRLPSAVIAGHAAHTDMAASLAFAERVLPG